ncbi:MAG TPA: very short patch repair endonuclease [Bacteroidia bacterium]|jgi:DNA mismatch endonuclease (patch repair protein)|nr:very short patch repair endonuclease [Bacteroidia bacterium]
MDVLTKEQRRRNMQAIRNKDTKAEKKLAKALWINGHRYRKNNKMVFGKPDLTFKQIKLAVFVDSEFFHGRDWETNKHRIQTNQEFWWGKIEGNIKRDKLVFEKLTADGWKVLRFWDTEVHKNLAYCICEIEKTIKERKNVKKIF